MDISLKSLHASLLSYRKSKDILSSPSFFSFKKPQVLKHTMYGSQIIEWMTTSYPSIETTSQMSFLQALLAGYYIHGVSALEKDNENDIPSIPNKDVLKMDNVYDIIDPEEKPSSVYSMLCSSGQIIPVHIPGKVYSSTQVFLVLNATSLALFDTLASTNASSCTSPPRMVFNVKETSISNFGKSTENAMHIKQGSKKTQVVVFETDVMKEEWMQKCIQAGMTFELNASENKKNDNESGFYPLFDKNMEGVKMAMEAYVGKVVLVVNVASA